MSADFHNLAERSKDALRNDTSGLLAQVTTQLEDITSDLLLLEQGRRPELATELRAAANRLAAICEAVTRPHFTAEREAS